MRIQPATSQPVGIEHKPAPAPKAAPATEQRAATVQISKAALEAATKADADGDGDGR